jgi:myosin-1
MNNVSEEDIFEALKKRHATDLIYTYIGNVVVSMNPFKNIPNLYSDAVVEKYRVGRCESLYWKRVRLFCFVLFCEHDVLLRPTARAPQFSQFSHRPTSRLPQQRYIYENPPHVFALAEDTYKQLLTDHQNQCVIISGESGAGKTEASKKIMQYVAAVSGGGSEIERVKSQILSSNPVLEAFGNAKTVRNNNSSRFGKYLEIFFDYKGDPVGGAVANYLLEKSRVVGPATEERNFHVFYQLLAGLGDQAEYHTRAPEFFNYLSPSGCFTVDGTNDTKEFGENKDGLEAMGLTDHEVACVFKIAMSVLWIGQVQFDGDGEKADVVDIEPVRVVCELLQLDEAACVDAMTCRTIKVDGRDITSHLDATKAGYARDALAKTIYFRLFDFIVARINAAIDVSNIAGVKMKNLRSIGVLDIYGFEIFEKNSFEQFCINFVNEKLQQIFIEKTIKSEQEEYKVEGIDWTPVDFFNNKIVCDLVERKPQGLLAYLDEECAMGEVGSGECFNCNNKLSLANERTTFSRFEHTLYLSPRRSVRIARFWRRSARSFKSTLILSGRSRRKWAIRPPTLSSSTTPATSCIVLTGSSIRTKI